ncbi:MAG: hypothetical protein R3E39_11635 [Anaerolineae bacterium]
MKSKFRNLGVIIVLGIVLAGCNLQTQIATPTSAPTETPLIPQEASPLPALTPVQAVTSQPTLAAPPLLSTPTALSLTPLVSSSAIPTIATQAVDQRYELQARAGQTVGVNYTITMTSGSITLTIQGVPGVVWQKTFTASETGRAEVTVQEAGSYEIVAQIDHFGGNYALSWD